MQSAAGHLRLDGRGGGRGDKGGALRGAAALSGAEGPRTDLWPGSGADCERGRPQGAAWTCRPPGTGRSRGQQHGARPPAGAGRGRAGGRATADYREPAHRGASRKPFLGKNEAKWGF